MTSQKSFRVADLAGVLFFLVCWGGSTFYLAATGADWTFPVIALVIFGMALSAIAWMATRGAATEAFAIRRPGVETAAILLYLAVYAFVFLGWGMTALRESVAAGPAQEASVLAAKLAAHVVAPAALLLALGANLGPMFRSGVRPRIFWRTLIILGAIIVGLLAVVSPSLKEINEVNPALATLAWAAPASFLWIAIEAGLNEEFLFRAVLQTRLSAFFKSPWAGVAVTSILFGLAHAPGLYLRGGPEVDGWSTDPLQVAAYTIATLTPLSLFFGFVYARTKSLLLVVLLHASVDFLPNLADFLRIWS